MSATPSFTSKKVTVYFTATKCYSPKDSNICHQNSDDPLTTISNEETGFQDFSVILELLENLEVFSQYYMGSDVISRFNSSIIAKD